MGNPYTYLEKRPTTKKAKKISIQEKKEKQRFKKKQKSYVSAGFTKQRT